MLHLLYRTQTCSDPNLGGDRTFEQLYEITTLPMVIIRIIQIMWATPGRRVIDASRTI